MSPERLGQFGESVWKNVLAASGWYYVPLANICDGGAPLARRNGEALILPDFDACRDGRSLFVEAKAKKQSILYRRIGKERHGINERNYQHYRQIAREYGKRMAIAILELQSEFQARRLQWSGALLIETFNNLGRAEPGDFREPQPKVYWNRKQFRELQAGLDASELLDIANGKWCPSFAIELDGIFFPQKQAELF